MSPTEPPPDLVTGRIYFPDFAGDQIAYVSIDGGGGVLDTTGATLNQPIGVSIDPVTRRIYWGNFVPRRYRLGEPRRQRRRNARHERRAGVRRRRRRRRPSDRSCLVDQRRWRAGGIYYANLDGSRCRAARHHRRVRSRPARDRRRPRHRQGVLDGLFSIGYANIDGTGGGGDIPFDNEFPDDTLTGLAIDQPAAHVYFASTGSNVIDGSGLDGSNVGEIVMDGVAVETPSFPSLLKVPAGAGAPAISGGPNVGSTLSCGQGEWVADAGEAFRWQSPFSYAYSWTRNNETIAGATSDTLTADAVGDYRCQVTGTNPAGSAEQVSDPIHIGDAACPDVSANAKRFTPRRKRIDRARAPGVRARATVGEPSRMEVDATLIWKDGGRKRNTDLGSRTLRNFGRRNLPFPLPKGIRDDLPVGSRVKLKLSIVARPLHDPDCLDPGTFKTTLKTRVAIVNDPGR